MSLHADGPIQPRNPPERIVWTPFPLDALPELPRCFIRETSNALGCDPATVLTDLLADLLHYCDKTDLDFAKIEERARGHYLEES